MFGPIAGASAPPVRELSSGSRASPFARLRLLGDFRLTVRGQAVPLPPTGQRLVALLGLERDPLRRNRAAALLWPDATESRAAGNLRSSVWRVRAHVPWLVHATPTQLALDPAVEVDVRQLLDASRCSGSDGWVLLPQEIFAGELLPDWYDDWLVPERERLRQLSLVGLERLAEALRDEGEFGPAAEAALRAIRLDPLRESAHRALIRVHLAQGNVADARRCYRACRALLLGELGVEPSAATRGLVEPAPPLRYAAERQPPWSMKRTPASPKSGTAAGRDRRLHSPPH